MELFVFMLQIESQRNKLHNVTPRGKSKYYMERDNVDSFDSGQS